MIDLNKIIETFQDAADLGKDEHNPYQTFRQEGIKWCLNVLRHEMREEDVAHMPTVVMETPPKSPAESWAKEAIKKDHALPMEEIRNIVSDLVQSCYGLEEKALLMGDRLEKVTREVVAHQEWLARHTVSLSASSSSNEFIIKALKELNQRMDTMDAHNRKRGNNVS